MQSFNDSQIDFLASKIMKTRIFPHVSPQDHHFKVYFTPKTHVRTRDAAFVFPYPDQAYTRVIVVAGSRLLQGCCRRYWNDTKCIICDKSAWNVLKCEQLDIRFIIYMHENTCYLFSASGTVFWPILYRVSHEYSPA
jgi:hypothetical protein